MGSRWLLYALGGGLGHFQRSVALARAAARAGIDSTILTNSPWAPRVMPLLTEWLPPQAEMNIQCLPANLSPAESRRHVEQWLSQSSALVVDTFPRGLGGELAGLLEEFGGLKVWVHRDISPKYLEEFDIRAQWAPKYDCIVAPGERGQLADVAAETPPWLLLNYDEVESRESARRGWGLTDDTTLTVVVVGCGRESEVDTLANISLRLRRHRPDIRVRFAGLNRGEMQWPLLAKLRGADLIVGSGGYNTVYEAAALGIPLVGMPQPRMYDRQARRLEEHAFRLVAPGPDVEDRVLLAVSEGLARCGEPVAAVPPFINGAESAVQIINSALK